MTNTKTKKDKNIIMLIVALVLIIGGSFFAGMFHTSFYSVKIDRIEFEADHGKLVALRYMPKGAGASDPRPVIVTTHGYLNSKEMQDAPAIEMSRRGYIVLAVDMYDHGDSRWRDEIPEGGHFGTFWIFSQFDAAKYAASQDYTKKDANGNAYVAVSGHSMGGFSTLISMYMDEMTSLQTGKRMIYTGISVGADYSYAAAVAPQDQFQAAFGSRTVGMIAAHYDEFFFNKSDAEKNEKEKLVKGTVTYKDFCATNSGKAFLGLSPNSKADEGKFYTVDSGAVLYDGNPVRASQSGKRIIYTPKQTHPWNHFSKVTTSNLIEFYTEAFNGVCSASQKNVLLDSNNQIWQGKEFFSLVAMIGFFLLFIPLISLLIKLPFFNKSISKENIPVAEAKTIPEKILFWVSFCIAVFYPAWLFPTLMDKIPSGLSIVSTIMLVVGIVAFIIGVILMLVKKNDSFKKSYFIGGIVVACFALCGFLLCKFANNIIPLGHTFNQPTTNSVVYWAMINGIVAAIMMFSFYFFDKKAKSVKFESYGICTSFGSVISSFATALVAVILPYVLLFVMQAIFGTDFRIWTIAIRTFTLDHLWQAIKYLPFFFVYYFLSTAAINANTRSMKKGLGDFIAIMLNIGGLLYWLIMQYGGDFISGVGAAPSQALNGIVMIALVPCLAVAAIFARRCYEKTNNVWLASFLNTMLFTMITVANTAMFWNFAK